MKAGTRAKLDLVVRRTEPPRHPLSLESSRAAFLASKTMLGATRDGVYSARNSFMTDQIARNEKQLGAILRRARKQAGLTQGSLGNTMHLRQGTVSRLEAGEPAMQLAP